VKENRPGTSDTIRQGSTSAGQAMSEAEALERDIEAYDDHIQDGKHVRDAMDMPEHRVWD
jgi:hypothetical protein